MRRSRRALQDALVALCLDKGFQAVTIEDITERADVSRGTFYAHYTDKQDLLEAVADDLWDELLETGQPVLARGLVMSGAGVAVLFRHALERRDAFRVVVGDACVAEVARQFRSRLAELARDVFEERNAALGASPRVPAEFLAKLLAADTIAVLTDWLRDPEASNPLEQVLWLLQRTAHGDTWCHGLEPGQLVVDEAAVRAAFADFPH